MVKWRLQAVEPSASEPKPSVNTSIGGSLLEASPSTHQVLQKYPNMRTNPVALLLMVTNQVTPLLPPQQAHQREQTLLCPVGAALEAEEEEGGEEGEAGGPAHQERG